MKIISGENNIFVDIDSTIVLYNKKDNTKLKKFDYYGEDRYLTPHEGHISFIKALHKRGFNIFFWSNNGALWCESVAKTLDLDKYVLHYLSKPSKVIDDEKINKWCRTIYIPENE